MSGTKLSKNLPKRCSNVRLSDRRKASFARGRMAKDARILTDQQAQRDNRKRGYTGKMLDDAFRKAFRADYRAYKRAWQKGDFTVKTMLVGALDATKVEITEIVWLDLAD